MLQRVEHVVTVLRTEYFLANGSMYGSPYVCKGAWALPFPPPDMPLICFLKFVKKK